MSGTHYQCKSCGTTIEVPDGFHVVINQTGDTVPHADCVVFFVRDGEGLPTDLGNWAHRCQQGVVYGFRWG